MFVSLPGGERMEVLAFLLLMLDLGGVVAATALRGKAWKDFIDRVTDKKN